MYIYIYCDKINEINGFAQIPPHDFRSPERVCFGHILHSELLQILTLAGFSQNLKPSIHRIWNHASKPENHNEYVCL